MAVGYCPSRCSKAVVPSKTVREITEKSSVNHDIGGIFRKITDVFLVVRCAQLPYPQKASARTRTNPGYYGVGSILRKITDAFL